ncbi:MAG: hypothetical protein HC866_12820 [Leptolyngbyaceae cyanobacterium RU_5_1]|nr:hypothetical protein [Leptolyngbyaceae cyanobacterium RU_5_1]
MLRQGLAGLSTLIILSGSVALADAPASVPVVTSSALGFGIDVPWSKPVRVVDPFDGEFLAVFDRNYFRSRQLADHVGVISLWSQKSVRVLVATSDRSCTYGLGLGIGLFGGTVGTACVQSTDSKVLTELQVKIRDQVFRALAQDGAFPVSSELAKALQSAPDGNVSIRLSTKSGETIDSEIGKDTVKAWRTVYAS